MNKRFVFMVSVIIVMHFASFSQVELTPVGGHFFGGNKSFEEGNLKINDNKCYGLILGFPAESSSILELSYTGMNSTAEWRPRQYYSNDYPSRDFGLTINYFTLSGVRQIEFSEKVIGFGAFRAGASWFKSDQSDIEDAWRFAVSLGTGLKFFFNEKIGLRLQGNFHMPLHYSGSGLFFGVGNGGTYSGVFVGLDPSIVEGDISGGLIFVLGK